MPSNDALESSNEKWLSTDAPASSNEKWLWTVRDLVCEVARFAPEEVAPDVHLMELGLDSLMLMALTRSIEVRHGVKLKIQQLFEELCTVRRLARHLEELGVECGHSSAPSEPAAGAPTARASDELPVSGSPAIPPRRSAVAVATAPAGAPNAPPLSSAFARSDLLESQLRLMERIAEQNIVALQAVISQQLAVSCTGVSGRELPLIPPPASRPDAVVEKPPEALSARQGSAGFRRMQLKPARGLSAAQRAFVESVSARFQARTPTSKRQTAESRSVLADWKHTFSFWSQLKEAKYPIISARSAGARFSDVDGNEYIDIAMGMGVHLFGHHPPFIVDALRETLGTGMEIGTQSRFTGDVARLIHEHTGVERVAFSNTGTEAVMVCLRLARAATGRDKVVLFQNSYHGIFDGVLGVEHEGRVEPIGVGTPKSMVADLIVLQYGARESLDVIRQRASEIGAVLVEPVQSRDPDLQPQCFLRRLRQLTREADIALIFDEMVTGFRCHPGGAQALLGIDADIVAYGKVAGGGLPIGVIAGKKRYLDYIDGGAWQYGDGSGPRSDLIFFGGTFARNPMTMTAARASLRELSRRGPELQVELNARTTAFVDRLNIWLESREVPLRVKHFASQFRIVPTEEQSDLVHPVELELLYLLMAIRGIYTWERRICFFSTEHGPKEVDAVFNAIVESIGEIRSAGFPFRETRPHWRQFLPVTSEQRRLYALCQRPGAESAYHLPHGLWIDGPLDADRLELAFGEVIHRHESLRTSFHLVTGDVCQKVHGEVRFFLARSDCEESEVDGRIREFLQPFDLSQAPLLRTALLRVSPERHLLVLDAHHIVVDGMSFDVIAAELMALYQGQELAAVESQLRDCARLIEASGAGAERKHHVDFWAQALSGDLPVLALPSDRPRGLTRDFAGDHVLTQVDPSTTRRLHELAREQGASLYMVLLALYAVLLHRLGAQEDLCIGAPASGRPLASLQRIVGMLANTIVIRVRPHPDLTFQDFLRQVQATCTACYDHADHPFAEVVAAVAAAHDSSSLEGHNPLFDTMLSYEHADARSFHVAGLEFHHTEVCTPGAMFDLNLDIIEQEERLHLDWGFATAMFERETVARWSGYFDRLIEGVLADAGQVLGELPLVPSTELAQLLGPWSGCDAVYPDEATLVDLFESRVREAPERTAVVHEGQSLSYGELQDSVRKVARALVGAGVRPGDFVGVMMEPSAVPIAALLGVLCAGAAYVPLDPTYPAQRLAFMIEDSGARAVIIDSHGLTRLPEALRDRHLLFDDLLLAGDKTSAREDAPGTLPDAPAYVIYTSGSTGQPKGCVISHRNVVRLLFNDAFPFDFSAEDTWIVCHSFCFDFSVWEMYGALLRGGRLVVPTRQQVRDPALLLQLLQEHRVSILNQTPAAFQNLMHAELRREHGTLSEHVRLVIFGGDRLQPSLLRPWIERYPLERVALVNMYGITETTVHVTLHRLTNEDILGTGGRSRIGRPLPETRVHVCNSHMQLQPVGVPGEILVAGSGVSAGYLQRPELTRQRFVDSPFGRGRAYRSGDLGRWLPDGTLEYLGRMDDQIQLHGFRIEPTEITQALTEQAEVSQAFVALTRHGDTAALTAYVVASRDLDALQLREHLLERLPSHMVPSHFVRLDALPLTSSGKIDRSAQPSPSGQGMGQGRPHVPPETAAERALAEVLGRVLGVAAISLDDNYYALGGDSIKAIFVATELQQAGYVLGVADVLTQPNVRALARDIAQRRVESRLASEETPRAPGPVSGAVPLSPVQQWFFEHHATDRQHDVHWVRLASSARLETGPLHTALKMVVAHHDQLRARFVRSDAAAPEVSQYVEAPGLAVDLEIVDLRHVEDALEQRRRHIEALVASLDLETGPLWRVTLHHLPDSDSVTIVVHHLVIDTVSWHIVLDDLASAYRAAVDRKTPELPPRTTSYQAWAKAQRNEHGFSRSAEESAYYSALLNTPTRPLPLLSANGAPTYADLSTIDLSLTGPQTRDLMGPAQRAYGAQIEDLLLTALGLALHRWLGPGPQRVLLEGHGRDGSLDVTRTVGWFTRLRALVLDVPAEGDLGAAIRCVQAGRAAIPKGGAGVADLWVALSSTSPEAAGSWPFAISLNYLGDVSGHGSAATWQLVASGASRGARLERPTLLDVEARVQHAQLALSLAFDGARFSKQDMFRLLNDYRDALCDLIEHCSSRVASGSSGARVFGSLLSDLELAEDEVEAVAPCSAVQEGILFHALMAEGEADPSYFEQLGIELLGEVDEAVLGQALQILARRHTILRTTFVHDQPPRPLQIVARDARVSVDSLDLRGFGVRERLERIEEVRRDDRERGFDLKRGPLLRLKLIRLDEQRCELLWSHHHILLDGWSLGILFDELLEVYAAVRAGRAPRLGDTLPYTAYVDWLECRDIKAELDYFLRYLEGYRGLSTLPRLLAPAEGPCEFQRRETTLTLSPERLQALERLCRESQVTLNTLVQGAWGLVLCAHCAASDVVFGTVVSCRPPELENVDRAVGIYLQTLPVRVRVRSGESLVELAWRLQEDAGQRARYSTASLGEIQELVSSGQALLDHVVVFENYSVAAELQGRLDGDRGGLCVGRVEVTEHMHYDFSLEVAPTNGLAFKMVFNERRIDPALSSRVLAELDAVLSKAVGSPTASCATPNPARRGATPDQPVS